MIKRWKRNVAKAMTGMVVVSSMVLGTFGWNVAPFISNITTTMADENVQNGENANEETQTGENAHVHTIVIDKAIEQTCEKSGLTEGSHCSVCNEVIVEQKVIPAKGHSFGKEAIKAKAMVGKNGTALKRCIECEKVTESIIYAPKTIQLDTTTYTYDGKAKKPAVTVKDSKGRIIAKSNYNVSYINNNKAGKATVTVTFDKMYTSIFKGKKIGFFGDSLTYGQSNTGRRVDNPFPKIIENLTSSTIYNFGVRGASATNSGESARTTFQDEVNNNLSIIPSLDYAFVMFGTNDFHKAYKIGDRSLESRSDFVGGLYNGILDILAIAPNCNIILLIPPYDLNTLNNESYSNSKGYCFNNYMNKILYVADVFKIPVIDLSCLFTKDNVGLFMKGNNTHYSQEGYNVIANYILSTYKGDKYTGSFSKDFTIKARSLNSKGMSVKLSKTKYEYTGKAIKPGVTVKYGKKTLKKGTDYTVTYSNNTKIGNNKAKVIIKGKGNYSGTVNKTFTIDRIDISKKKVSVKLFDDACYGYTGKVVKPQIESVKIGSKELVCGTDYTVRYSNNKKIGRNTAKVIIVGKGIYKGTINKKFSVLGSASGKATKNIKWSINVKNKTLTISGKGNIPNYNYPKYAPWVKYRDSIKTIIIKKGITGIGDGAFRGIQQLEKVSIPNGVKYIGKSAFDSSGSNKFNELILPSSVEKIGKEAFCDSTIKSIKLNKGLKTLEGGVFYESFNLKTVEVPEGIKELGLCAFYSCSSLKSIKLPKSLKIIGEQSLSQCIMTTLIIPENVTEIGRNALTGNTEIKKLYVKSKKITKVGENALGALGYYDNCTIYVPKSKLNDYKKLFANKGQGKNVKFVGE